ncbi:hypothetical protein [Parasitella parasitica]|uniref:Uncharacterized protein n=1 Tax=Parasitella parasitica TaxID=35722 RepID=A0A0B7MTJ4_9FUNG|nr:hypothetical protein [Parasitella parasitica]
MRGVPIFPPGTNEPGAGTTTGDIQQALKIQNNQKKIQKNEKTNDQKNEEKIEKNKKKEKEPDNKEEVTSAVGSSAPDTVQRAQPSQRRVRKLPIAINTSSSVLHTAGSKRRFTETPVTPSILSRLSGTLSSAQNELVSKFGKTKNTINCEHCTNIGCISITSLRHDSDSDENEDMDANTQSPIEFQCIICHRQQSMAHINQALGIISKKQKNIDLHSTATTSGQFIPLPGTPASMVSAEDNASSARYMQLKNQISCIECNAIGTMVKFGFTSSSPPRPRFQCSHCKRIFNISILVEMMSQLTTSQPTPQPPTSSLSPPTLGEDILITDAQQPATSEVESQNSILPIWLEDTPPPISSPNTKVITFLLDSVKKLTEQANNNQHKFDYINTLIEQNEQLKNELKEQKKENESQKKEIEMLKKIIKEKTTQKKNTTMNNINMNTTANMPTFKQNSTASTEQNTTDNTAQPDADATTNVTTHMNIDSTNPLFPPLQPTARPSYAQQARKPAQAKIQYAPGQFRSHKPTTANLELASKLFNATQQPPTAEYKYLYFPSNKRMKPSVIRSRLTLLGVDNVRILDAHCPDWNVIALLIHANYETELLSKFTAAQVQPIQYDRLDPVHLRDQRHAALSNSEKVTKLQNVFKNNLMRSLSFMRYPTCYSVAKYFNRQGILTAPELSTFLNNSKRQQIATTFPPNAATNTPTTTPPQPASSASTQPEAVQSPPAASDIPMQL